MSIKYNIIQDGPIVFFKDENHVPFLIQTSYPNGDRWKTLSEMHQWAILKVAEIEDEGAPFAPAGSGISAKNKPNKVDLENAIKAVQDANSFEEYSSAKTSLQELYA